MDAPLTYRDTRGLYERRPCFSEVVVEGLAPGGGLFVPTELPQLSLGEILELGDLPYWRRAAAVFERFAVDLPHDRLLEAVRSAYGHRWDDPSVAPVRSVAGSHHVLELWHGPTSAFKDLALQAMPRLFSEAITQLQSRGERLLDYLVLVATSGDTGKAALDGFAGRPHTGIVVFYPADGVSDVQRLQMITQEGANVGVFGVRGNFDDCQTAVKGAFSDPDFATELRAEHRMALSSANSINWGRLMPQIVYYLSAYADMAAAGAVVEGDPIDVCVPTGNFGNILAAYYARALGAPIERLVCASNENNVLSDFIATGTYDITHRRFVTTPSPSMDILVSSNLERLLFELTNDPATVRQWMAQLADEQRFSVDRRTFEQLRCLLVGDFVSNEDSLETIARVWRESEYLIDPHTAVAWEVADRLAGYNPLLVVATAHWAKFGADVYRALHGVPYGAELPAPAADLDGLHLLAEVVRAAPGASPIPRGLATLAEQPVRFDAVVPAGTKAVEEAVKTWLADRD